jgi:hypothetical protein
MTYAYVEMSFEAGEIAFWEHVLKFTSVFAPRIKMQFTYQIQFNLITITFDYFPYFGVTAPIWALVYLHETLRFTLIY